jgi:hypothetical protein
MNVIQPSFQQTFLYIILLFLMNGCGPKENDCKETKYETVAITAKENSSVPYSGNDTLLFVTESGDTNIFMGNGKVFFYDREDETTLPYCPPYSSTDYQGYKINYMSNKGEMDFVLELHTSYNFGKRVIIDINEINRVYGASIGLLIAPGLPNPEDHNFIDQITLNGYTYTAVRKCPSKLKYRETIDSTGFILYNKEEGIIQLKFDTKILTKIK